VPKAKIGPSAPQEDSHDVKKLETKWKQCVICRAERGAHSLKNRAKRKPLKELTNQKAPPLRTSYSCKQCKVALCVEGGCWKEYHNKMVLGVFYFGGVALALGERPPGTLII